MNMPEKNNRDRSQKREDSEHTGLALPAFGLSKVFEDLMRPFDRFVEPSFPDLRAFWPEARGNEPSIDIQDRGDHFVLTAEMPGFDKKEVEVQVGSDSVELKAERKSNAESKSSRSATRENSYSLYQKYLTLPEPVLSEKAVGTMKNGVLELKLPKKEPKARDGPKRVDLK
jgi:HSP20 family protein